MDKSLEEGRYAGDQDYAVAEGPFQPAWASLKEIQCPEVAWKQTALGLEVEMPPNPPTGAVHAIAVELLPTQATRG